MRSWIGSACPGWVDDSDWGIFDGAVTERWLPTEAAGGELCMGLIPASSSIGNGTFKEPNESCLVWCGLAPAAGACDKESGAGGGLQCTLRALSSLSALNNRSSGELCRREGIGMGAPRDGDGEGEEAESEPSSGGGVGGPECVLGGTDLERNFGMGRAEGAGEAWKVGPAYAPWVLAGVVAGCAAVICSVSVKEAVCGPLDE